MEGKLEITLIVIFGAVFVVWQVHAQVNCTETGAGRFADENDTTCQNYTLCVYNSSSTTYLSYDYVCPTTSLFNPNTAVCTTNYTCESNSTDTNSTDTNSTDTNSTCSGAGRFADTTDTTCKTYILCVLETDGTYDQYNYTCPTTSVFSPTARVCTTDYNCTTA